MIENGMLSGSARYHDDRGARATAQARMSQIYTAEFLAAIDRNNPEAPVDLAIGTDTIVTALIDQLYDDDLAAQLVAGLSLLRNGKFECGAKALIEWTEAAALKHGAEVAEYRGIE